MITRLVAWASITAVVGVLAGCGPFSSGSGGGSGGGANTPASSALSCDLAPAALVNTTLGTKVGDPTVQTNEDTVIVCTYPPTTGLGSVLIRIQTNRSDGDYSASRATSDANGIPTKTLKGFADKAYTSVLSAGTIVTNTLVALEGTTEILVSSPATIAKEIALEQLIFAKLS